MGKTNLGVVARKGHSKEVIFRSTQRMKKSQLRNDWEGACCLEMGKILCLEEPGVSGTQWNWREKLRLKMFRILLVIESQWKIQGSIMVGCSLQKGILAALWVLSSFYSFKQHYTSYMSLRYVPRRGTAGSQIMNMINFTHYIKL